MTKGTCHFNSFFVPTSAVYLASPRPFRKAVQRDTDFRHPSILPKRFIVGVYRQIFYGRTRVVEDLVIQRHRRIRRSEKDDGIHAALIETFCQQSGNICAEDHRMIRPAAKLRFIRRPGVGSIAGNGHGFRVRRCSSNISRGQRSSGFPNPAARPSPAYCRRELIPWHIDTPSPPVS